MAPNRPAWRSPSRPWHACTPEQKAMLEAVWRAGDIAWKLTPSQQQSLRTIEAWEKDKARKGRIFALDSSRRWGKSALLVCRRISKAMQHQGMRYVYCAPTHDMVRKIVVPLFDMILQDCPPALRPEWVKSEGLYQFGNGTRVELIGLDVRPDGARGTGVDDVDLDEAGFFENLEYLLMSVLYPQMLGRTHATIVAASTPPTSPAHYWSEVLVPEAVKSGAHDLKTLDDADQYTIAEIEEFYAAMPGGRNGVAARREYGAQHIADETLSILPEFRDVAASIVREVQPPTWRDCYTALDPGFHDLSAVLFGYWDFVEQRLVVEDELAAPRLNSWELAQAIKKKERELWGKIKRRGTSGGAEGLRDQPFLRVSDNDPRLLFDLQNDHGLTFVATQKDHLVQQVDAVRVALQKQQILIHPRCKKLVAHCKNGVWRKAGKVFGREGDFGHFDLIAALVYLWRNIQKRRNPAPKLEQYVAGDLLVKDAFAPGQPRSKWARPPGQYQFYLRTGKL